MYVPESAVQPQRIFAPNQFAYAVPPGYGTQHYVLWYAGVGHSPPLDAQITAHLEEELAELGWAGEAAEFVWYPNPKPTIAVRPRPPFLLMPCGLLRQSARPSISLRTLAQEEERLHHVQVFWRRRPKKEPEPEPAADLAAGAGVERVGSPAMLDQSSYLHLD